MKSSPALQQQAIEAAQAAQKAAEAQVAELEIKVGQASVALDQAISKRQEINQEMIRTKEELNGIDEKTLELTNLSKETADNLDKLNAEISSLDQKQGELREQLGEKSGLENTLNKLKNELGELEQTHETAVSLYTQENENNPGSELSGELGGQVDSLAEKIQQKKAQTAQIEKDIQEKFGAIDLNEAAKEVSEILGEKKSQLSEQQDLKKSTDNQIKELREQSVRLNTDLNAAQERYGSIESDLGELEKELREAEANLSSANGNYAVAQQLLTEANNIDTPKEEKPLEVKQGAEENKEEDQKKKTPEIQAKLGQEDLLQMLKKMQNRFQKHVDQWPKDAKTEFKQSNQARLDSVLKHQYSQDPYQALGEAIANALVLALGGATDLVRIPAERAMRKSSIGYITREENWAGKKLEKIKEGQKEYLEAKIKKIEAKKAKCETELGNPIPALQHKHSFHKAQIEGYQKILDKLNKNEVDWDGPIKPANDEAVSAELSKNNDDEPPPYKDIGDKLVDDVDDTTGELMNVTFESAQKATSESAHQAIDQQQKAAEAASNCAKIITENNNANEQLSVSDNPGKPIIYEFERQRALSTSPQLSPQMQTRDEAKQLVEQQKLTAESVKKSQEQKSNIPGQQRRLSP